MAVEVITAIAQGMIEQDTGFSKWTPKIGLEGVIEDQKIRTLGQIFRDTRKRNSDGRTEPFF